MTLFEYLGVLISIILSFGIIRLLDGIPSAFARDRGYWVHGTWVILMLWLHVQYWWAFWSYKEVTWNYPKFVLALGVPLLIYSLAITVVPRDASGVASWREHFYGIRVRFFSLYACWTALTALQAWLVLEQAFFTPLRLGQGLFVVLCVIGAMFGQPAFQGLLAVLNVAVAIWFVTSVFIQQAPLVNG
ncbi:MAG: hypothetical protein P8Y95_04230 [Gammaproteobacteria bacterium]|jgi:hypothetical protein